MSELRRFFIALGYFTRLPIPFAARIGYSGYAPNELSRAARYFPAVGLLIGLLTVTVLWTALQFFPLSLAVLLSMTFSLGLTGGFHEDGLADSADAFGGGWEKADVLRIMKDSRIGSYGSLALIMALAIKFAALYALSQQGNLAIVALLCAHPLSRHAALLIMGKLAYVRDDDSSRAKPVAESIGKMEIGIGSACALVPLLIIGFIGLLPWPSLLAMLVLPLLSAWVCAAYFTRRIGGYTGDCLGAAQQVSELVIYLTLCAAAGMASPAL